MIKNRTKDTLKNPTCIKDINMSIIDLYGTNLKHKKEFNDGFNEVIKLKRNFK